MLHFTSINKKHLTANNNRDIFDTLTQLGVIESHGHTLQHAVIRNYRAEMTAGE